RRAWPDPPGARTRDAPLVAPRPRSHGTARDVVPALVEGTRRRRGPAMTDAHQVVIARIRSALAAAPPVASEVPRDYETALPGDVDVVALFAERSADSRATIQETSADGLAATVASILVGWGAATLIVPA